MGKEKKLPGREQYKEELMDEYSVDYIFEKLNELKPDAGFTKTDVENAINTLETQEYLHIPEASFS